MALGISETPRRRRTPSAPRDSFALASPKSTTLEPDTQRLSDRELLGVTDELRERLAAGESLDDLLPEAFAAVREAVAPAHG